MALADFSVWGINPIHSCFKDLECWHNIGADNIYHALVPLHSQAAGVDGSRLPHSAWLKYFQMLNLINPDEIHCDNFLGDLIELYN